jgi:hypothetical protein
MPGIKPRIRTLAVGAALATGGAGATGLGVLAANPDTEVILYDGKDYDAPGVIDDRACKECNYDIEGEECWCPPPDQPITEKIVCGCYDPTPEPVETLPDPEPPASTP